MTKKITFVLAFLGGIMSLPLLAQYTDYIGAGHSEGIEITASSFLGESTPVKTLNGSGLDDEIFAAGRFLSQATFGGDRNEMQRVIDMGFEGWIDDQFTKPIIQLYPQIYPLFQTIKDDMAANGLDTTNVFGPWALHFHYAWWDNMMKNEDLLRQRVANSLSEILVISINSDLRDWATALSSYHDLLMEHSFGNYEDLLMAVTRHPAMGFYLSHLNNPKLDLANNIRPDENYAREIMQLFSIGLYELNQDGSRKVDVDGNFIPTYDNDDIKEFAKVFTGLGAGGIEPWVDWTTQPYFGLGLWGMAKNVPMKMYENWHQPGEKYLLNGFTIPAGQTGMEDIEMAVNHLFNHPNVGPFLARRLIQRLVKSNPTPAYIERVANAFSDNGSGVRGDMKAVIKAILLDEEARSGEAMFALDAGKMREPTLRYTHFSRTQELDSPYDRYWNHGFGYLDATKHHPFGSPTVFNFYAPDFTTVGPINDAGYVAPEFKLLNTSTAVNYINNVHAWTMWSTVMYNWEEDHEPNIHLTTSLLESLSDDPELMINELDKLLTHGQLSDEQRQTFRNAMEEVQWPWNEEWRYYRARLLLKLFMISPDYIIMK